MIMEHAMTASLLLWGEYWDASHRCMLEGKPYPKPPRDEHGKLIEAGGNGEPVICVRRTVWARLPDAPSTSTIVLAEEQWQQEQN